MHSAERDKLILECLVEQGFISFRDLEKRVDASPATIRRDLERLMSAGLIKRVRGGATLPERGEHGPAVAVIGIAPRNRRSVRRPQGCAPQAKG
jgi:DeoR family ulaG and ulaABCDEF operon transcriptional repressor